MLTKVGVYHITSYNCAVFLVAVLWVKSSCRICQFFFFCSKRIVILERCLVFLRVFDHLFISSHSCLYMNTTHSVMGRVLVYDLGQYTNVEVGLLCMKVDDVILSVNLGIGLLSQIG